MILTKDNLLRFVKQQRYVLPTTVASEFDTTTMIASAALSELAKDKVLSITYLKLSSSPYYYDTAQPEALQELAEKHLSGNELNVYNKVKEHQIVSKGALSIPEQLAMEKIEDFAKRLEMEHEGKEYIFYVWYLRNLGETKKQIQEYFTGSSQKPKEKPKKKEESKQQSQVHTQLQEQVPTTQQNQPTNTTQQNSQQTSSNQPHHSTQVQTQSSNQTPPFQSSPASAGGDEFERAIEQYFHQNYLHIESKQKGEKGISYNVKLRLNSFTTYFDCFYFEKKPQEAEIISFYVSSVKPKIVFIKNPPKKLYKLSKELDNLEIVNL